MKPVMGTEAALAENLANWDERARLHLDSYRAEAFADDPGEVELIVADSVDLMRPHLPGGSVDGLQVVHLQCHIGNDSISLARLGADVTGVDFSGEAVAIATSLARRAGLSERVRFAQARVEEAPQALGGRQFDLVYTSVGVLCWLPDMAGWARAVAALLKPGGLFFILEDHPMLCALDWDAEGGRLVAAHPYFWREQPLTWDDGVDYSSPVTLQNNRSHEWAHPLSELFTVLLEAGLSIESFQEHRKMYWKANDALQPTATGEWALADHPERVPLMFSLAARKPDTG
ncbi:MAG: class I SAM-dependent methyltransferase [Propionibacteriaceae bacterium]|jgi:SAM-dependent methyltransferase|nr:class I SAM-dependent methyltransferase [Propionibacteriaceae bacterium]